MSQQPPPPPPPPPPGQPYPSGQPYPPGQSYPAPQKPKSKAQAPWIILAVVLGVIILCCGAGGIFALSANDDDGDADKEVLGSDAASADGTSSDTTAPGETSTTEDSEPQDFQVESGFTSGTDSIGTHYTSAGARIRNPNPTLAAYNVQVLFNLVAANGDVLDSTTETVGYIGGGETVPVAPLQIGFEVKKKATDLEVQVVGEFSEDEGPKDSFGEEATVLKFKGAEIVESTYTTELSGQVTNQTDAVVTEASWDCIYVNGSKIVGGASSSIIDPIPPGSTVQFSEYITLEDLPIKSVECRIVSGY